MRGSTGATGPAGPSGIISPPLEITFTPEQNIIDTVSAGVPTMVLLATTPSLVAGTYCVWVEHDYANGTGPVSLYDLSNSFYGIYVGANMWSNQREIGSYAGGGLRELDKVWRKASIFHIVIIDGTELLPTINLRYIINNGMITCGNGTIIYQKIA